MLLRLRAALHRPRCVQRAVGACVLDGRAGNVLAGVLVDAPTVADGAVALNALESTVRRAFGHVVGLELRGEYDLIYLIQYNTVLAHFNILTNCVFCSSKAAL